jgi:hypothetical protein
MVLVPAPAQLLQPLEASLARVVVRPEAAGVHPGRIARCAELEGDHPRRCARQELAVVAHVQDRLGRAGQPLLQPALARDVEEVVGFVQQQHLVRPPEQRLEHQPFLLTARQGGDRPPPGPLIGNAERTGAARVPGHLGVVSTGIGVLRERGRVPKLGALVVAIHQHQLDPVDRFRRRANPLRGH